MKAETTRYGALAALSSDKLSLLLHPASEVEDGLAHLVLRVQDDAGWRFVSLFGQTAPGSVRLTDHGPVTTGTWAGLDYVASLRLGTQSPTWFWHVTVTNRRTRPVVVDVVHTHDLALAPRGSVRASEYYVSQYLDLTPVAVPGHGTALSVRQNMPGTRQPWALVGCLGTAVGWATDARQLAGRARAGSAPLPGLPHDLPSTRLQHEHTLVALQTEAAELAPGEALATGFFGLVEPDHPAASGPADAALAATALDDPAAAMPIPPSIADRVEPVSRSFFTTTPGLSSRDVGDDELATLTGAPVDTWQHVERADDGTLLAFTTPDGEHVVTAAKERRVLRPHGHLLRTGSHLVPDERGVTSTAWMAGWFVSQLTQGHVSLGSILSLRRTYLGLLGASGLRLGVTRDGDDAASLLGMPSAWAVTPGGCRWWYLPEASGASGRQKGSAASGASGAFVGDDGGTVIEVTTTAHADRHEVTLDVEVRGGASYRLDVLAHVSLGGDDGATAVTLPVEVRPDGLTVRPPEGSETAARYPGGRVDLGWPTGSVERVAGDEALFTDGVGAGLPWLCLRTMPQRSWSLTLTARLVADEPGPDVPTGDLDADAWTHLAERLHLEPPATTAGAELARLGAVLPWFAHDAVIHYLSPRGLEQFTGGGWGTRDVCQGPVGLLVGLAEPAALREVVLRIFAAQNARGDWPQAFDFLGRHRASGQGDAHGDVVYWPLLALADHLATSDDTDLLEVEVPFTGDDGWSAPADLLTHVSRALDAITGTFVPGTSLPRYGHGDWNDSLQPADPDLARHLVSTWTVTLQAHALRSLADALSRGGEAAAALARRARDLADAGVADLRRLLVLDGILAGYGVFADDGTLEGHLVHPSDDRTGLRYSVLPMIHAISGDLLTREEAAAHLEVVERHLTGPDGARLFDAPAAYRGGPMEVFQRAEASTFFGREIGIMYTHAHLRYAEALARFGDARGLLAALALANPVGMTDRVASARPRQSTTYYSSSDAAFPDRAAAAAGYAGVLDGTVPLEGGWRVYSSGPGLVVRLVVECLLGIRRRGPRLEVDPVLDPGLDGTSATVTVLGGPLQVTYRVGARGHGVRRILLGDNEIVGETLVNPYRPGGLALSVDDLLAARTTPTDTLRLTVETL